jgi:hypothetical protein
MCVYRERESGEWGRGSITLAAHVQVTKHTTQIYCQFKVRFGMNKEKIK